MAKQSSFLKLKGSIGGVTYYKTQDGFLAREKGGIDADRIKNDPAFQRTRENGSEFGRAGSAGKMIRTAFRALLMNASDNRLTGRLTREMVKVIQMDQTNPRGQRNVIDGEIVLLDGFEFNSNGILGSTLFAPFTSFIDRPGGNLQVDVPSFIPLNMISAPPGATHFKLVSAGAGIDFENETYVVTDSGAPVLPIDSNPTPAIMLSNIIPSGNPHPLMLVLGIEFYQEVNGGMYSLRNGAYNCLTVIKTEGV